MANTPQNITVLGSTGSIGVNTLDVIARHPQRFRAYALSANTKWEALLAQCRVHQPKYAVMLYEEPAAKLATALRAEGSETQVLCGVEALEQVASASEVDAVMAAIVGAAGMRSALAAAQSGKRVLLANKETLVMAGHLFMEAVAKHGATLLPIDSEHNAIFQCMPSAFKNGLSSVGVTKILLTASGGPFRRLSMEELAHVTPEQALKHPNWAMGPKITIDSATLMNKGLEVIEAHWLFGATAEQIEVVVHPQSMIHSLVQYNDGSVLAELGNPDMRTPIAHALAWPERIESGVAPLDLFAVARLDFEKPDMVRFPCLRLAFEALARGGTAPALLNAANEVAVAAFLAHKIAFMDIPRLLEAVLENLDIREVIKLEDVIEADESARAAVNAMLVEKATC
ncbi:MAG: 1-deoxy-D-xylulose-5-phosphate reductoisomerase [Methylophilaceae bacterium]